MTPAVIRRLARRMGVAMLALACVAASAAASSPVDAVSTASGQASLAREVEATERAFARSMAERDPAAFARLVADEAVFLSGASPLRGKPAVLAAWAKFFEGPQAPFSWVPDLVEVLPSGQLAWSTGPVKDAQGRTIARFQSVWRRNADGNWQIVFDQGSRTCEPTP